MNNIAETIKALRKKNDMSQEQLAESLFVSRQAISKWERGEAMPDIENLTSLSQLFGVSVDELISGDNILNGQDSSYAVKDELMERKLEHQHLKNRADVLMIVAIMMYIIAPFIFVMFENYRQITPIFGILVAIATGIIIYSGTLRNRYRDLVGVSEHEEEERYQSVLSNKVSSLVSILATIAFLILGFFYGLWHPGWVVFLLVPLSRAIINLFEKEEE